ncbi:MAG: hypothetical protein ACRCV0_07540 [Brevinema sp.]
MNVYWVIGSILSYVLLSLKSAYLNGLSHSFRKLINILIPFILGGITARIGRNLLPNSVNLVYYMSGIGTLLFYMILHPIINKVHSYRYKKISRYSRQLACLVSLINVWILLSFIFFFIHKIFVNIFNTDGIWISILNIPLNIFWLFPE